MLTNFRLRLIILPKPYKSKQMIDLTLLSDEELEALRCDIENEQRKRIDALFENEPEINEPPFTDAVDDQDGASELPPLGNFSSQELPFLLDK